MPRSRSRQMPAWRRLVGCDCHRVRRGKAYLKDLWRKSLGSIRRYAAPKYKGVELIPRINRGSGWYSARQSLGHRDYAEQVRISSVALVMPSFCTASKRDAYPSVVEACVCPRFLPTVMRSEPVDSMKLAVVRRRSCRR